MKISVVTISFNQASFLKECIESVLAQDYKYFEYIIVDPGSQDGSREIIEDYQTKFSGIVYEPDAGPADGLNKGFARATGEIFYYLNADDIVLPGSFRTAAEKFWERPDCDILLGRGYQLDQQGRFVRTLFPSRHWTPEGYAKGLSVAIQQSTFFRAKAYRAAGGFNAQNRTCWDGELIVDMVLAGATPHVLKNVLGAFRIYPESITGSQRLRAAYLADQNRIRAKILKRVPCRETHLWFLRFQDWLLDPRRVTAYLTFKARKLLSILIRK